MAEARGSKVVSHAARKTRQLMVERLKALIAREYPNEATSAAYEKIGEATGVSLSTMQRVMSGKTGPSIDTLSDIARHLGSTVAEILSPLDASPFPKAPPESPQPPRPRATQPRE